MYKYIKSQVCYITIVTLCYFWGYFNYQFQTLDRMVASMLLTFFVIFISRALLDMMLKREREKFAQHISHMINDEMFKHPDSRYSMVDYVEETTLGTYIRYGLKKADEIIIKEALK